jgi:hypothetical protein
MRDIERKPFQEAAAPVRIRGPDGASMIRPARRGTERVTITRDMGN